MDIRYDFSKLQKIIEDFSKITKIDISLLDINFKTIAHFDHGQNFCDIIHKSDIGQNKCIESDKILIEKCLKSMSAEYHICHAGFCDIAVPIKENNTLFGIILLGRLRINDNFSAIMQNIGWIDSDTEKLKTLFYNQQLCSEQQIYSISRLVTAITALIVSENMVAVKRNEFSQKIEEYIKNNLDKKLTVDYLCKHFNISKNTLYETFHFSFDTTVNEYISRLRIEKAKQLLSGTDLSIGDIIQVCGFGSYTYFFKVMKDNENMTPREYRLFHKIGYQK